MNEAVTLVKIEGESALVADYDYTNATWTAADGGGDPRFYTTGDEVTHSGGIYRCLESHSADNTANTGNERAWPTTTTPSTGRKYNQANCTARLSS